MTLSTQNSGESEAVILIKASPQVGLKYGETVCCAGIDLYGNWLRLYPVSFRYLEARQKFSRWDRVKFNWRRPKDDMRIESRRVDQDSIEIIGKLKDSEKDRFLEKSIVTSLENERIKGKSLALLKAEIIQFHYENKSMSQIQTEENQYKKLRSQIDMFSQDVTPKIPCPYNFKYKYKTDDGIREGTCQDWEIEATYFRWSRDYGEEKALSEIMRVFGQDYPEKGMLLAMGTHSLYPDTWLINGIIRLNEIHQGSLF